MNTRQKTNWWIDASLFVGLIACFYLNLTGVEVHQWLGILGAGLAVIHMMVHWNWITAVTQRFVGRTSGRARLNYLINLLILTGLTVITVTGLVISTWLNLSLGNYPGWLQVHIVSSIVTLSVTVLKLILHWRWIVSATRSILTVPPVPQTRPMPVRVAGSVNQMSRGEFLKVMGIVGATSFLALVSASATLKMLQNSEASGSVEGESIQAASADSLSASTSASSSTQVTVDTDTAATSAGTSDSPEANLVPEVSSESTASNTCFVRCNHHCSYPGHCRKYTDADNNGYCDLGECA